MFSVYIKEINSFLNSLIGYIVICVFLIAIGLLMWVFPETSVLNYGFADMDTLFSFGPYVFMFLIPAITMRTFAEEKKSGTMELLLTRPISDLHLILGKYFSGLTLVIFALIPTGIYYYTIYQLGNPEGNVDTAGVIGSYIGLFLLGAVFTAIGVLSSAVTENQVVAFIIGIFLCFILYVGFGSLAAINPWGGLSLILEQLGLTYHYNSMSRGLLDTQNIVYFLSVIALMIFLTKIVLGSRKW
ncbi:MAG: gliding motility-associated ABC transporter permease subunit GldF [Bacteroidota bacterium]|nr:gliding motility-associated ABC transporter permease subunit GldF [Bacteroidota bacterium]